MPRRDKDELGSLTRELGRRINTRIPYSFEQGQERLRLEVKHVLGCSGTRARHVLASLVAGGYVRFGKHPYFSQGNVGAWTYHPRPRKAE